MRGNMLFHWFFYHLRLHKARTQTTDSEREALRRYAHGRQHIVELGVFEGVTSRYLRGVMASNGTLYCIDPFLPGILGFSYGLSIATREVNFEKNGVVRFVRKLSYDAVKSWNEPVDLIFIDADHSYESVRQDWEDWSPHVVQGGIIALHDSRFVPGKTKRDLGPIQLVKEIVQENENYKIVEKVDTLTVFKKHSNSLNSIN